MMSDEMTPLEQTENIHRDYVEEIAMALSCDLPDKEPSHGKEHREQIYHLRWELNAALEENRRLRKALKEIVQLKLEGHKLSYHPATQIAVQALQSDPIASAKILNAASEEAVNNVRNQIESKRP